MRVICCFLILLISSGCVALVVKQDIPVSSNPMGASIYANGNLVGYTPTTVSLERNRDHIVTIVKTDYRQEDIPVVRQYLQNRVMMRAIQSGVNSGLFFKDARMGINSGMQSISMLEQTGEAYVLVPSAITLNLIPLYNNGVDTKQHGYYHRDNNPSPQAPGDISPSEAIRYGAGAGLSQVKPVEKKWESSSTKTYVRPDGTRVTETSGSSVKVGVNPVGLFDAIDQLFR